METNCEKLLKEVMAADFTLLDLGLYLNTHPNDVAALTQYQTNLQRAMICRKNYEMCCGPLTQNAAAIQCNTWKWIQNPWPWNK